MRNSILLICGLFASTLPSFGQVLVDFQVAQPPPVPLAAKACTVQLFEHAFGNSFGAPEVFNYTPPTDCGEVGSWAAVTLNFTVTANGTQFDRLGIFTFQNVEIWRTSTPEPIPDGIIWTYTKDVTRYIPLFADSGTLILELDNLLETGLNGIYSTVLEATFYESSSTIPAAQKANVIIPISAASDTTDASADASVSPAFSTNVTVPQNSIAAYAEIYASGNGDEEFWYFNAPNAFLDDLPSGFTFGDGPFREARLLIDGLVAGTAFPYPVIFTGGISPPAWQPITSYGALDLPTYVLDVTPFLPLITDGSAHNFTIDVVSAETDGAINQNWFISALLQVVTASSSTPTTGNMTVHEAADFPVSSARATVSRNGDVTITVTASRTIHIESDVCNDGTCQTVIFDQSLEYSNVQTYLEDFAIQNVLQTTTGAVSSTHNGVVVLKDNYSYPFAINITSLNSEGSEFDAVFDHSYNRELLPAPFLLGSTISERQIANGFFDETSSGNFGNGTSSNTFNYVDTAGNTYARTVSASDGVITSNTVSGTLADTEEPPISHSPLQDFTATFAEARLPGGRTIGI